MHSVSCLPSTSSGISGAVPPTWKMKIEPDLKPLRCTFQNCYLLFSKYKDVLQHIQEYHLPDTDDEITTPESTSSSKASYSQSASLASTESGPENSQVLDSMTFSPAYDPNDSDTMFPFDNNFLYTNEELSLAMSEITETFDLEWIEEFIDNDGNISLRPLESAENIQSVTPSAPPVYPDQVASTCELKHPVPISLPVPNALPVFQPSLAAVPTPLAVAPKVEVNASILPHSPLWSGADSSSEKIKAYAFPKLEVVGYLSDTASYTSTEDRNRHFSQEKQTSSSGTDEAVSSTTSRPYSTSSSTYWEDPRVALGLMADSASNCAVKSCGFSTIDFTCLSDNCPSSSSSVETKRNNAVSTPKKYNSIPSKVKGQAKRGRKRKAVEEECTYQPNSRRKLKDFREIESIRDLFDSPVKNKFMVSPSKITLAVLLKESKKPVRRNEKKLKLVRNRTLEPMPSRKNSKKLLEASSTVSTTEQPQPAPVYYSYEFIMSQGLIAGRAGHGLKPYVCPVPDCDKTYKNANGLKYHARYGHSPRQEFPCESCNKIYTTRHGLMAHLKSHPGYVKPKNEAKVKTLKIKTSKAKQEEYFSSDSEEEFEDSARSVTGINDEEKKNNIPHAETENKDFKDSSIEEKKQLCMPSSALNPIAFNVTDGKVPLQSQDVIGSETNIEAVKEHANKIFTFPRWVKLEPVYFENVNDNDYLSGDAADLTLFSQSVKPQETCIAEVANNSKRDIQAEVTSRNAPRTATKMIKLELVSPVNNEQKEPVSIDSSLLSDEVIDDSSNEAATILPASAFRTPFIFESPKKTFPVDKKFQKAILAKARPNKKPKSRSRSIKIERESCSDDDGDSVYISPYLVPISTISRTASVPTSTVACDRQKVVRNLHF